MASTTTRKKAATGQGSAGKGARKAPAKAIKRTPGRPKVEIDWQHVGKLLEAGATAVGIAATIGCDEATLYRRCEADNNIGFAMLSQQKKAKGDELLRTAQFKTAMSGNVVMQIWLGKQRLGQTDKTESRQDISISETNVIRPSIEDATNKQEHDAEFVN